MKKLFFAAVAVMALLSSCEKPNKCKCKFELKPSFLDIQIKLDDQIIDRPEEKRCSDIKLNDVEIGNGLLEIDASKIGKIKCTNYYE